MDTEGFEADSYNDSKLKGVSCENCFGTIVASDSEVIGCRGTPNPGAVRRLGFCFQGIQQGTGKKFETIISFYELMKNNPQSNQSEG